MHDEATDSSQAPAGGTRRISHDPDCTDGPCRQDGPLILGAALEAILLVVYLVAMGVLAVREDRGHTRQD